MVPRLVRARRRLAPFGVETLMMARWENVKRYARWLGVPLPRRLKNEAIGGFFGYQYRVSCRIAKAIAEGKTNR